LPKRNGLVVARTRAEVQAYRRQMQAQGKRVAFIPTMGALHEGHLSLVRLGLEKADVAASSIFVNPTQFAAHEDLSTYPRTEAEDLRKLQEAGCSFCYCPTASEMYPPGDSTRVQVKDLSHMLEGEVRPHFFEGVASVVSRLFLHVGPDVAVFGEKDYQQLLVIRRMVQDLGFPIEIVGGPTMREPDGLAMSSRNAYLTGEERTTAAALPRVMQEASARIAAGERISATAEDARQALIAAGLASVDYVAVRRADTLAPFGGDTAPVGVTGRLLIAARLGKTRLIDNVGFVRKA
jgi:pantoate--beta-alanine ligase